MATGRMMVTCYKSSTRSRREAERPFLDAGRPAARYHRRMPTRSFRPSRRPRKGPPPDADALVREATDAARARQQGYRERSLALHGWICAKCAREFERADLHLLTVHHKDGNHHNNPPDGSNWENLCVYCHDDEHSRNVLAEYLARKDD